MQHMQERPVEQQRECGIDARLQQIERQEHRAQQRNDLRAGNAHVKRGDQIIPQQHADGHRSDGADQSECSAENIAALFVDERCGAGKCCTCYNVHDHADQAGLADEQLQYTGDNAAGECGKRAVEEPGERQENILRLIAQEADDGHLDKQHGNVADGAQQRKDGQLPDSGCILCAVHRHSGSGSFHGNLSFLA